eukprot:1554584-Amphidinium_carterae.1
MCGVRRVRALTGRLAWAAGVYPRGRWAVNILHAVLAWVEKEIKNGIEEKRRADKSFLLSTKWVSFALCWWCALLSSSTAL